MIGAAARRRNGRRNCRRESGLPKARRDCCRPQRCLTVFMRPTTAPCTFLGIWRPEPESNHPKKPLYYNDLSQRLANLVRQTAKTESHPLANRLVVQRYDCSKPVDVRRILQTMGHPMTICAQ